MSYSAVFVVGVVGFVGVVGVVVVPLDNFLLKALSIESLFIFDLLMECFELILVTLFLYNTVLFKNSCQNCNMFSVCSTRGMI